ncbi:MAG: hypothetical protein V2A70_02010 [Candidatus Omnitrophota bacterium]
MHIRNIVLTVFLSVPFAGAVVDAQSDIPSTFDYTLETLRQSVLRLSKENETLAAGNTAMHGKIKALEGDLRSLEEESRRLNDKRAAQLEKERRRPGNADLLKENMVRSGEALKVLAKNTADEEAQLKKSEIEMQGLQQQLDSFKADMVVLDNPEVVSKPFRTQMILAQQARESARKEFYDVANQLQDTKKRWQEANAVVLMKPKQIEAVKLDEEGLKKTVAGLETDLAALKTRLTQAQATSEAFKVEDCSDLRFGRLESELKDVTDRNRKAEIDLLGMQKIQDEKLKRRQEERDSKRKKLQATMDELGMRNQQLRKDLSALRQQMVTLDKKKAKLEGDIYTAH